MSFNLIEIWNNLAIYQYHVNPGIFVFLMIFSIPFYYYGWYGIGRAVLVFRNKYKDKKNKLKVSDILMENQFLMPLGINRTAWVLPYLYVIFWGQNIPLWFWLLFFGWIIISSFLFWNKLKERVQKNG